MANVIEADHISKLYGLGRIGTGSFRQDIKRWWVRDILKREDPFFAMTEASEHQSKFIWALKDISFEVKEGEVFGIIGRNGAGKSTLLKILSKVIKPTKGVIRGRGRINSLLEIGTGFHDELSGRENIYLNGYFMGMHRDEIKRKFDEIVAFSGVEQFLDTPVKRYSSGMYVRLAFAVAAHLEPDILIVDEVLAVGDADFQKKCLGKMHDVSTKQGRTILFVSHNMQAVHNLCNRAMFLHQGVMKDIGPVEKIVNRYLAGAQQHITRQEWPDMQSAPGNEHIRIRLVELIPHRQHDDDPVDVRTPLTIRFQFWNLQNDVNLCIGLHLHTQSAECIFDVHSPPADYRAGLIEGTCHIPGNFLNDGSYYFSLIFMKDTSIELFYLEECLTLEVEDYRENINWYGKWAGYVRPRFPFTLKQCTEQSQVKSLLR
jgi:lipopolysaccharide transport system ATP-binding protein